MKTLLIVCLWCALFIAAPVRAQLPIIPGGTSHETAAPDGAHFQIIQAQTAAKWTFRLDRITGHVWILVQNKDGSYIWQVTKVDGLPDAKAGGGGPYQIFLSGLAAKFSFLIDTSSGRTWALTTLFDKDGKETDYMWKPFAE